jgi:hypothetical protein
MGQNRVEMKMRRVETGWYYAAPAVLNSLNFLSIFILTRNAFPVLCFCFGQNHYTLYWRAFRPFFANFFHLNHAFFGVKPQRVNPEKGIDGYDFSSKDRLKLENILWLKIAIYERARTLFEERRQSLG